MNDEKKMRKFLEELLKQTKKVIVQHAPGMPAPAMSKYMEQIGGEMLIIHKGVVNTNELNPFRLRVTVQRGIARHELDKPIYYIEEVLGWG